VRRLPISILFPYTTLFRSDACYLIHVRRKRGNRDPISLDHRVYEIICAYVQRYNNTLSSDDPRRIGSDTPIWQAIQHNDTPFPRSEEHTSELQSRENLVCR